MHGQSWGRGIVPNPANSKFKIRPIASETGQRHRPNGTGQNRRTYCEPRTNRVHCPVLPFESSESGPIRSGAMTTALRLVEGSSMDKSKALDAALSQIERTFGKGSIMRLGKNDRSMDVETVSTGSLGLDIALGIGG